MIKYSYTVIRKGSIPSDIVTAEQKHSDTVFTISQIENDKPSADALVTNIKCIKIGVLTADCVPIIYYDEINEVIAVSHNGWMGMASDLIKNTVNAMSKLGADTKQIKCIIGPSIGGCCYNIFGERKRLFESIYESEINSIFSFRQGKHFLDLKVCAKIKLNLAGIEEANIATSNICTQCEPSLPSFKGNKKTESTILTCVTICPDILQC